jgi:virginiamycin A acetyltransferase
MAPDPTSVRIPGMIDDQERNTVFLKPLVTSPKIEIGEYTYYNDADNARAFETDNVLYAAGPEKLIIGRFCAIATGARFLLSAANHPILGSTAFPFFIFGGDWLECTADLLPRIPSRGDTVIGNDVWIGMEAIILPGIKIGDGSIVAARSVVSHDVPPYAVVAGDPAKVVKMRFDAATVRRLVAIAWWNWPADKITRNLDAIRGSDIAELENAR